MAGLLCFGLACHGEAEPDPATVNAAEAEATPSEPPDAPEQGQWKREQLSPASFEIDAAGWAWSVGAAAPRRVPLDTEAMSRRADDALDFRAQLALASQLELVSPKDATVALRSKADTPIANFLFGLETLAKAGVRQVRWQPEDAGKALELSFELPRYEWAAETQAAQEDPSELVLALRGQEVIAGLRPLAYFAQDRIAGDIAAISNRAKQFRTPLASLPQLLPLATWTEQLCADAKDGTVHIGLSVDTSTTPSALWTLAGSIEAPTGCSLALRLDNSLPARPEGNNPNLHVFADAQRIVDLTRPAEPRVRLHADRLRNAALQASDEPMVIAREPELMMTVTDEEGRKHIGIRRKLWSVGREINDCYRKQRESTPLWAPRVVATGMLRAPKRKPYVAIEGLEAAPEFSACVKTLLEKPMVSEMDRLLGFRAEMDFFPFGGVVHN